MLIIVLIIVLLFSIYNSVKTGSNSKLVYHIAGPSGSGKSYIAIKLLKKYGSKIKIIDTDEIDDYNAIKAFKKQKEITALNKKEINKQLNTNKPCFVIGFLHNGMQHIKIHKGFMIKIDANTLWKQYNKRTASHIAQNYSKIIKDIDNNTPYDAHIYFSKKYGIRNGFDCVDLDFLKKDIQRSKLYAKKNNYFYGTQEDILTQINSIINLKKGSNDSLKIIKKLGSGWGGTTYLVKLNGTNVAMKIEHILLKNYKCKNYKCNHIREIEFNKVLNNLPEKQKQYFMLLYKYELSALSKNDMKQDIYKQELPPLVQGKDARNLQKIYNSPYVIKWFYTVIDMTIEQVFKLNINIKAFLNKFRIQFLELCKVLISINYKHNDLHFKNVGIIGNPEGKFQIKAIDYGAVCDQSKAKILNKSCKKELIDSRCDALYLLSYYVYMEDFWEYLESIKNFKWLPHKQEKSIFKTELNKLESSDCFKKTYDKVITSLQKNNLIYKKDISEIKKAFFYNYIMLLYPDLYQKVISHDFYKDFSKKNKVYLNRKELENLYN